jgi:hypothetical protein
MNQMKTLLFSLLVLAISSSELLAQKVCCPYVDSIQIIPKDPMTFEPIRVVTIARTPCIGNKVAYSYARKNDTFNFAGCYYSGVMAAVQEFRDTTNIGFLPEGLYLIDFMAKLSGSETECMCFDSNSISKTFQVRKPNGIALKASDDELFQIYPIPASEYLTVNPATTSLGFYIEVVNSLGQICLQKAAFEKTILDLNGIERGVYLILITEGSKKWVRKISKL